MSRKTKKPTTNPNPAQCACGKSCYFAGTWTCQSWCFASKPVAEAEVSKEQAAVYGEIFARAAK